MTYTYNGTQPWTKPRQTLTFDPTKCGTRKGYRQHQNHAIPACKPCRQAHNTYMNNRNATLKQHPQELAA